ncbi:hypothetical protein LUZ63_013512 [Rhynchospora breviuscula]|uniref:Uncharacterized protein n=1 Tax=Rhynchospora breviuscula TaxID=2022672 RepID=A0A9Q0C8P2_9POAL|nr:hypothetical protein LUZ63_013512 [Rhynchospora breviuscula]
MVFETLHNLLPRMPRDNCSSWLMGAGFCFLILGSVVAVFVSDADVVRGACLNAANILILTLFWWLRAFGQAAPPPTAAKVAVWFFSTSIMGTLTWSMTMEAPLLVKTIFWVFVAVTSLGTSCFIYFAPARPSDPSVRPLNVCFCFCLTFVFFSSVMVSYKAYGANIITDRINSVIFEFASWFASLLLVWCIAGMEIASRNSAVREWMKFGSWAFATMLAFMVVAKVAELFPWPMKCVAWAMFGASSSSSLLCFLFPT